MENLACRFSASETALKIPDSLGSKTSRLHLTNKYTLGKDPYAIAAKQLKMTTSTPPALGWLEKKYYVLLQRPGTNIWYKVNKNSLKKRLGISEIELEKNKDKELSIQVNKLNLLILEKLSNKSVIASMASQSIINSSQSTYKKSLIQKKFEQKEEMKVLFGEIKNFFKEPGTIKVGDGEKTISVTLSKENIITIQNAIGWKSRGWHGIHFSCSIEDQFSIRKNKKQLDFSKDTSEELNIFKEIKNKFTNQLDAAAKTGVHMQIVGETLHSISSTGTGTLEAKKCKENLEKLFMFNIENLKRKRVPKAEKILNIDLEQVKELLNNHKNIFDQFKELNGNRTVDYLIKKTYEKGLPILTSKDLLNNELKSQLSHILAYCKNSENQEEVKSLLIKLAEGFTHCQAEQQRTIADLFAELVAVELTFQDRIADQLASFKEKCFDEVIFEMHPSCVKADDSTPSLQFAHIKSNYLVKLGEEFGLQNVEHAKLDNHRPNIDDEQIEILKEKLNVKLTTSMLNFALSLAEEWNVQGIRNDDQPFQTWINENGFKDTFRVLNEYVPFFYNKEEENDYILLNSLPNEKQLESNLYYFKPIEVLQILTEIKFLQRKDAIFQNIATQKLDLQQKGISGELT